MTTKKVELTEGWLCRDSQDLGGGLVLIGAPTVCAGMWNEGCVLGEWGVDDFGPIYGMKQAPDYGEKMLVDMQL